MPSPAGVGPTRARGVSEADLGAAAATIATLGRANDGTADREEDPDQTIEEVSPSGGKRGRALGSTVGKLFKSVKLKRKKGAPAGTDSEPATPA